MDGVGTDVLADGRFGLLETLVATNRVTTYIRAYANDTATSNANAILSATVYNDGTKTATCTETVDASNEHASNSDIITRGYLDGSDSNVVHRTGDETIAGNKTFSNNVTIDGQTSMHWLTCTGISMTAPYQNGTDNSLTNSIIRTNCPNTTYGLNVAFGAGGNTIVGGGESWSAQLSALETDSGENLYLCADTNVYIKSNCQTFSNGKVATFGSDGSFTWDGKSFCYLSTDQTIGGVKTFSSSVYINRTNPYLYFVETDWEKGTPQSSGTSYQGIYCCDELPHP